MIQAFMLYILVFLLSSTAGLVNMRIHNGIAVLEGSMVLGAAVGVCMLTVFSGTASWLTILVSLAASSLAGIIVTMVSISKRKKEDSLMLGIGVSIAAIAVSVLISRLTSALSAGTTLNYIPLPDLNPFLIRIGSFPFNLFLPIAMVILCLFWFPIGERFKMQLAALGDHEDAAISIGVPVRRIRFTASAFSGCLSGLAGLGLALIRSPWSLWLGTIGFGFLAIFAVFSSGGERKAVFLKSLILGTLYALGFSSEASGIRSVIGWREEVFQCIPFFVCLILLLIRRRPPESNKL
ncbi:MAG: iron chelate uptake ABC transporter family permease subunit [Clostridia bacterium]|nr:iron chelate uptake ABC transporter family permease subunit [Clostridia bacterium]